MMNSMMENSLLVSIVNMIMYSSNPVGLTLVHIVLYCLVVVSSLLHHNLVVVYMHGL